MTTPRNPYVFVVGSPRSGTTLLKRMLDAHPALAMTRETHWIARYYERGVGVSPRGNLTPELLPRLLEHRRFSHLKIGPREVEKVLASNEALSYADFVTRLFDLYGRRENKPLVGDKTPPYVRKIGVLSGLWPHARFVHLIRDGRSVCLSIRHWRMAHRGAGRRRTWSEDPVSTTALWWEWLVRLGREAGARLPADRYYELRYEQLVADPAGQCRALCRFLALPWDEAMLRYHEGRTRPEPGLSANGAWLPPTKGLRDWRAEMSPQDLERFEACSGGLLAELGYPKGSPGLSLQALRHAARMRDLFDGRPLPEHWAACLGAVARTRGAAS